VDLLGVALAAALADRHHVQVSYRRASRARAPGGSPQPRSVRSDRRSGSRGRRFGSRIAASRVPIPPATSQMTPLDAAGCREPSPRASARPRVAAYKCGPLDRRERTRPLRAGPPTAPPHAAVRQAAHKSSGRFATLGLRPTRRPTTDGLDAAGHRPVRATRGPRDCMPRAARSTQYARS
jgi:hypothetical protein